MPNGQNKFTNTDELRREASYNEPGGLRFIHYRFSGSLEKRIPEIVHYIEYKKISFLKRTE